MTGTGTLLDPFIISTAADLQDVTNNPDAYYEVANDIDCSGITNFDPICNYDDENYLFGGHFDGKGFTISNVTMDYTDKVEVGLFGNLDAGATLMDIHVREISIRATGALWAVGALMADTSGECYINDCDITGTIHIDTPVGYPCIGGIVGYGGGVSEVGYGAGIYQRCWSDVDITIEDAHDYEYIGGLAGESYGGHWSRCFALGDITCLDNSDVCPGGGFGAVSYGGIDAVDLIEDCYARGNVIVGVPGDDYGAGFISIIGAWPNHLVTVRRCYSTGSNNNSDDAGGFIAIQAEPTYITIEDCFWDTQTSGKTGSDGATGKTTAEMKATGTFSTWDFSAIWAIVDGCND